jgi:hypothetical protein
MPPRGVKSSKRARQYSKIKASAKKQGKGKRAAEIAARTVNKQRRKAGETKAAPRRSAAGKTSRSKSGSSSTRKSPKRSTSKRSTSKRSTSSRSKK